MYNKHYYQFESHKTSGIPVEGGGGGGGRWGVPLWSLRFNDELNFTINLLTTVLLTYWQVTFLPENLHFTNQFSKTHPTTPTHVTPLHNTCIFALFDCLIFISALFDQVHVLINECHTHVGISFSYMLQCR